jgi:hypothetical protein
VQTLLYWLSSKQSLVVRNWGIVLLSLAGLSLVGEISNKTPGDAVPGLLLFGGSGGALFYFGSKRLEKVKEVATEVNKLLRQDSESVSLLSVSKVVGLPEIELRPLIAEAQKKKMLPFGFQLR